MLLFPKGNFVKRQRLWIVFIMGDTISFIPYSVAAVMEGIPFFGPSPAHINNSFQLRDVC